jgi:beta-N-acetylhexosaminidase
MLVIGISPARRWRAEERRLAPQHPAVGGVILFTRNFASRAQVTALCAEVRAAAHRDRCC